jgi:heterodisulfide reductase subunit C1
MNEPSTTMSPEGLNLSELLMKDVRFVEGMHSCINCGTCSAICPAAEFYNYDPRLIAITVQSRDNIRIEKLLKSDSIWYCGECLSCKTRCPKNNTPGYIIQALRHLSHKLGYFTESEKGRQSLAIKRTVGEDILKYGYCTYTDNLNLEMYPEQGPVWDWVRNNAKEVYNRLGGNYKGNGPGALRKVPDEALDELKKIFDITGGSELFETIEKYSKNKALELGLQFDDTIECEYFMHVYTTDNKSHNKKL